jgi:peptidase C25-like protein
VSKNRTNSDDLTRRATVPTSVPFAKGAVALYTTWMVLMLTVLPTINNARAAGGAAEAAAKATGEGKGLASLLNADGTMNLSAGVTGSYSANGYRMELGADKEPRFVPTSAQSGCVDNWDSQFIVSGPNSTVAAIAVDGNNNLYIGGSFTTIGDVVCNFVAKWDGVSWSPLGSAAQNGVNGMVSALAVMGTDVFVGGGFSLASDSTQLNISASNIARWSTTTNTWSRLGGSNQSGVNFGVLALTTIGADLYVGGLFTAASDSTQLNVTANHIARWSTSGNTWSLLGSGSQNGVNSTVLTLTTMGTDLYVGGNFNTASSSTQLNVSTKNIARWSTTESTWSPLGSAAQNGVTSAVMSLAANGTDLYVGGSFNNVSDSTQVNLSARGIARWSTTSSTWSPLGSASQNGLNGAAAAIIVVSADLYVAGAFNAAADSTQVNLSTNFVARWSTITNSWSRLGSSPAQNGVNAQVNALALIGTDLFVGGLFSAVSDSSQLNTIVNRIARWSTTANTWSGLSSIPQNGVDGSAVKALVVVGTDLYIGGAFSFVGNVAASNIAKWDGVSWSALGSTTQNGLNGTVFALAVLGSDLYVGGNFNTANDNAQSNLSARSIARWSTNTNRWSRLGSPTQNGVNAQVNALGVMGADLYVGGFFTATSDSVQVNLSANRVARWNSTTSTWSPLGSSTQNGVNSPLFALAVMGTDVYVGGSFTTASDSTQLNVSANHIARWGASSNNWSPLGSSAQNGVNSIVEALAVSGTDLYVGHDGTLVSDSSHLNLSANHIARWSATTNTWSALGSGTQNGASSSVLAIAVIGTEIYAGGLFTTVSSNSQPNVAANHIARWRLGFSDWVSLEAGTNAGVSTITQVNVNDVYIGGTFGTAGCHVSSLLGRYTIPIAEMDVKGNGISIVDGDTTPDTGDNTDFGVTSVGGGIVTRSFTIEAAGTDIITLTSNPPVVISGANAADFVVSVLPASTISRGGSTTFAVQFRPTAAGLRTATVTIANNDTDENPYDFAIQGTGFAGSMWTGANSSDWHTASNWASNSVPAASSDVLLPSNGVINEAVIGNNDLIVGNLTVSAGRTVTLSNNRTLTVANNSAVTINTSSAMIINSGCTVICSSGASLINNGTLTNNQGGTINNGFNAVLTNTSVLNNNFGAAINNNFGATLTNAGGAMLNNNGTLNINFGATLNNPGSLANLGTISNSGTLALESGNINVDRSAFLFVRASGTVTRTTGYVIGRMTKTFGATGSFTFDVGTASGYSPVNVTATAGSGDLTISAAQGFQPVLASVADKVLQRYWTLNQTGNLTVNLVFAYLQSDVMGNESNYRIIRVSGSTASSFPNSCPSPCVDIVNNTASINGVSTFSDWTLGEPAGPTAIELESFSATGYDGGTYLEWQTGFEASNLGFNLYREQNGERVRVNPELLAGSALLAGVDTVLRAGRSYSWWDSGSGKSGASYWLEDIDLNGQSNWHGPCSVRSIDGGAPVHRAAPALSDARKFQQSAGTAPLEHPASLPRASAGFVSTQNSMASQPAVKISVNREGWYNVSASDLAASGLDPKADPQRLQLYVEGRELPMAVTTDTSGQLASIGFYGRGLDAPFTDARVYWLVAGTQLGLRIAQVKGNGYQSTATGFLYTVELKDRTIYFSALRNGDRENFFGAIIAAQPVEQNLTLQNVDRSATGLATIELALQGVTMQPHRVWTYINGAFAGELNFFGQAEAVQSFSLPQSLLKSGDNEVKLVPQGGTSDVSLVDYIRLSYWHEFTADDDALQLTVSGKQAVTIDGFTTASVHVFDITDPDAAQELVGRIEQQKTGYAVTITSPGAGDRRLLAITDAKASKPAKLALNESSSWRSPANGADLLVISRRNWAASLQPLISLRQSQGLKVALVGIEDIYDEFSFGEKSPQAIKDLLSYAKTSWKIKPRYVLLAGDASYDARNYLGFGDLDIVPTKLIDTLAMEAASDDWLADLDGDGIADLAIGRLPARTAEEAATMVRKIVDYENSETPASILLVADGNEGFDFEAASGSLRGLIPGNLTVGQINRGRLDPATAKSQLLQAITRGQKVVNYVGHGSVNLWRGGLLTNDDARALTNAKRLPVFVMMTCLNGYFDDPSLDSLGESLLKTQAGGAVAVWASSGMTLPEGQASMNQQLYRLLFCSSDGAPRIGDAVAKAKLGVADTDIRRTWILLGDPTMRLK